MLKKILTVFGRASLLKTHMLCQHKAFKITMYMQSMICLLGQQSVFESGSKMLKKLLGLSVSAKQIQRVSEWYGGQIDPLIQSNHIQFIPQLPVPKVQDEFTYTMMDGSMLCTVEKEKWKEVKLARIFHGSQNIGIQKNRNYIARSVYISHVGSIAGFFPKLERHLALLKRSKKVFIGDGAKWIWKWVEDNYPGAIQILDYYHAIEKIELLAKLYFIQEVKKKEWLDLQKELLFDNQVLEVIQNIRNIRSNKKEVKEVKNNAINYYLENEDRMMYKTFREMGLLIGSGPIESAHRNIIQQRLKLSGQKWSISGAQSIINLRCYEQSGEWKLIENLIKLAA